MDKKVKGALDKLWYAKRLIDEGRMDDARPMVENLERESRFSPDDQLTLKFLKSQVLITTGNLKTSYKLVDHVFQEKMKNSSHIHALDACFVKADCLLELGKLEEVNSTLRQCEEIISKIQFRSGRQSTKYRATLLHLKGQEGIQKGEFIAAGDLLEQSLGLFEEINNNYGKALSTRSLGVIFYAKENTEKALEYHWKALKIFQELGNKFYSAFCYTNIGGFLSQKGDFNQAIETSLKGLTLFQELGHPNMISYALGNTSNIYMFKGEKDRALDYCLQKLAIDKEQRNKWNLMNTYDIIGKIYLDKDEFEQAYKCFQQLLELAQELGHKDKIANYFYHTGFILWQRGDLDQALINMEKSHTLRQEQGMEFFWENFRLVCLTLEKNSLGKANEYLGRLRQLNEQTEDEFINQTYQTAMALVLKASPRIKDKVKAQELFQENLERKQIFFTLTELNMMNLCELRLDELKAYNEPSVLEEAKTLVTKLYASAQNQQSFSSVVRALSLQTKLTLIEGNLPLAVKLLNQALLTAEENNLGLLIKQVTAEIQQLEKQSDTWKQFIETNAPYEERIEYARVTDYLKSAKRTVTLQNIESST
ncbi:MAG: tetratricopeptide repeat protein [Candidatus Hodarchaeales archaeon]|jgi:tetratricopeptide (TPR) repeat protein